MIVIEDNTPNHLSDSEHEQYILALKILPMFATLYGCNSFVAIINGCMVYHGPDPLVLAEKMFEHYDFDQTPFVVVPCVVPCTTQTL